MKEKTWIRVSTAAKLKGVRRQTIYWHINEGNLSYLDLDGNKYVDRDEVIKLEHKGKTQKKIPPLRTRP
jgi:predicted site-specific integrase-resolvase